MGLHIRDDPALGVFHRPEEEFDMGEANEDELAGLKTVGDAVNFVASKLK